MVFLKKNLYKVLLTLAGLVMGILFITVGFWKTILIVALMLIGLLFGARLDSGRTFKSIIHRLTHTDEAE